MSADTYSAIIEAIQEHIRQDVAEDQYARDWILVCGVETATMGETDRASIRIIKSPRTAIYSLTGLLDWAQGMLTDCEDDDDDE